MTQADNFLHDIIVHPDDSSYRLIFGDWLQQQERVPVSVRIFHLHTYAQGDATFYSLYRGGKEWLIHDKAHVWYEDIVLGLLRMEWPGVEFELVKEAGK